jgi:hypothetical protein
VFCHSFFMGKTVPPVEIHRELLTVHGANVMTVHVQYNMCVNGAGSLTVVE